MPLVTPSSAHVQGISFTVPLVTPSRNFPTDADPLYDDAAVLRDKIKGTFVRGKRIDRRSNPFPVLLSVKI